MFSLPNLKANFTNYIIVSVKSMKSFSMPSMPYEKNLSIILKLVPLSCINGPLSVRNERSLRLEGSCIWPRLMTVILKKTQKKRREQISILRSVGWTGPIFLFLQHKSGDLYHVSAAGIPIFVTVITQQLTDSQPNEQV